MNLFEKSAETHLCRNHFAVMVNNPQISTLTFFTVPVSYKIYIFLNADLFMQ